MAILDNSSVVVILNDEYATDKWLKEIFEEWHDPNPMTKDFRMIDMGEWKDKTFCNPPYSNPLAWIERAIEENKKGKRIVLLLKMDTSTRWFKKLQEAGAHFLWINGRLKHRTGKPAAFPSMLAILSVNTY